MVQWNEANLESFEEAFSLLKAEVDTQRINVPSDSEDDKSPTENPTILSLPATPASSTNQLKESMGLLELYFAEFKELTQARLSDHKPTLCSSFLRSSSSSRETTKSWHLTSEEV